jgi:hypothetical protein
MVVDAPGAGSPRLTTSMTKAMSEDPLEQGRDAFRAKRWSEAVRLLSAAEERSPVTLEDYEALAVARFLISPDQVGAEIMGTASQVLLDRGDVLGAVRAAFWASATLGRLEPVMDLGPIGLGGGDPQAVPE